eukprot:gene47800-16542_t
MAKRGNDKQQLSETKSAMQDLLNELDQTRREYAKVSLQLTQQETMIQHLKDSEAKKDQVLAFLQDELQRVHQMHGQEKDNRQLRDTLMEHQAVIEKLQNINEDLKTRASSEMTDFRSQLENEFKRRLADSEKEFRAQAEEAKIALQGNDHLQMVLQRQNDSIEG